ncbi:uncharacterized protein KY384_002892 [Bacidia gigantensis]|uniref:uncharacterized protein n=1 Tax=Bacidia gigantensis TaxID=2732470 RepID=UPI001D0478A2|nr:uncharacterized protein KY384_002892 [Bacidia gigantensis]KAG8532407.1 hypothetical protein KY384_002892 [Bacidia gigantensis]
MQSDTAQQPITSGNDHEQVKEKMHDPPDIPPNTEHVDLSSTMAHTQSAAQDWRSPVMMLATFFLGVILAFSLHGYYTRLDGKRVGKAEQQQNALSQYLWKTIKRTENTVKTIDAAFDALHSLLSFLNLEVLSKFGFVSFIAIIAWCLPFSTVITPATLNVRIISHPSTQLMDVPELQISNYTQFREFAYTVAANGNDLQKFLGPRTVLVRLATATASTGQILQLPFPLTNATYSQTFFAPFVRCENANATVASQIDTVAARLKSDLDPTIKEISNHYLAFVPALSNTTSFIPEIQAADLADPNGAVNASNQVWVRFARSNSGDGSIDVSQEENHRYLVCTLRNASYHVRFTWTNGKQAIDILDQEVENFVTYATNVTFSSSDEANIAYSAFMWALSTQIVGQLSFYQDVGTNDTTPADTNANRTYSLVSTNLKQTSLIGSSDLNSFFLKNHALGISGRPSEPFSPQRLQDMDFARNRTLDVMIEELSVNMTIGLLSNPRFIRTVSTNVTTNTPQNIYDYHARNLVITYGIGIFFSLVAVILGLHAFRTNGVSYNTSWWTIVATTRNLHFADIGIPGRLDALPQDRAVAATVARFGDDGFRFVLDDH